MKEEKEENVDCCYSILKLENPTTHNDVIKTKAIASSEKAVTLVALVVTIVVLLILAGVSIAMLSGDNGLINQANLAKEETEKATIEELVKLEALGSRDENGDFDSEKFKDNVENNLSEYDPEITEDEDTITVTIDDTDVVIDKETGDIYDRTKTRPKIITSIYQTNGQPAETGVAYENVIITVEVPNRDKFDNIEIELQDSNGTKINPDSQVTGQGDASYTVKGEGIYTITVKGTIDGKINTETATVEIIVIDEEIPPVVTFGTNGSTTYSKSQSTVVTITDEGGAGVDSNNLKYQWTQSAEEPAENTFTIPFSSGETITKSDGTGNNWYLWILAKDKAGNTTIQKSNVFYLDNTPPTTTKPLATTTTTNSIIVTSKQTDSHSGINESTRQYAIKKSSESTWGSWITDSNTSHTFTDLELNVTYDVKTRVQDIAGNGYIESDITSIKCEYNTDAKYTIEHYQEKLSGDGYDLIDTEEKIGTIGSKVTETAKIYEGFKYDGTIPGTISTGTVSADGSLVLKLYYVRNTYTVSLSYDSTTISEVTGGGQYKYGQDVTIDATLKEEVGYTFTWNNWTTSDGEEYTKTKNYKFTMPAGNLILTAKGTRKVNTYTIKYDGNGATGGTTVDSTHTYDLEQSLTTNGYTRTGYAFKEWNTNPDGTGTSYTDEAQIKNITSENGITITLYAQWVDNISPTIISLKQENTSSNISTPTNLIAVAKDDGSGISAFQFSTESNLTENSTGWIPIEKTTEQTTLKYEIAADGTYYFYVKDDSNLVAKQSININNYSSRVGQYSSTSTNTTYCSGCKTKTTYCSGCVTPITTCSPPCMSRTETVIEPVKVQKTTYHTYTCRKCGASVSVEKDHIGTYCSQNNTTSINRWISKWDACSACGAAAFTEQAGLTNYPDKKCTHTIKYCPGHEGTPYCPGHEGGKYCPGHKSTTTTWHTHSYTVKYNVNNGTGSMSNSSFTCNSFGTLRQNTFTREGYTFIGWSKDANATIPTYADNAKVKNLSVDGSTVTLYAIWKQNT